MDIYEKTLQSLDNYLDSLSTDQLKSEILEVATFQGESAASLIGFKCDHTLRVSSFYFVDDLASSAPKTNRSILFRESSNSHAKTFSRYISINTPTQLNNYSEAA